MAFRNAATVLAAELRERVLYAEEETAYLGSEQELITLFGVSVPTLRQAARILEAEGLLSARRGINGGYFARTPTSEIIAHVASVYLRAARHHRGRPHGAERSHHADDRPDSGRQPLGRVSGHAAEVGRADPGA